MKVRAVKVGWYGLKLRQPGEVFEIDDDPKAFSDSKRSKEGGRRPGWMERVEEDVPSKQAAPVPPPASPASDTIKPGGSRKVL